MKKQLNIYIVLILIFAAYNIIEPIKDQKLDDLINILLASILFLYIAYIAFKILKKLGKNKD